MKKQQIKQEWLIEWNQKEGCFHIDLSKNQRSSHDGEWRTVGIIYGAFADAHQWANEWMRANPLVLKVHQDRVLRKHIL